MAAGLGAESLAAKFKQGGALGTYRDKWLLLSAADVEAEDRLAKKFGIPLIRAILGSEALNMADILGSWFRNGRSKVNTALSGKGHEVQGSLVFKAGKMERFGDTTRYIAFGSRPERSVEGGYITKRSPSALHFLHEQLWEQRERRGPHFSPDCCALARLHAGCRKHGEAARDLFCGRRRQWA